MTPPYHEGSKRAIEKVDNGPSYWLWSLPILITIAASVLFTCAGCFSTPRITRPPAPSTAGEAATFVTISKMAWFFVVPGVVMLGASYWIPPLKKMGAAFLIAGIGAAVLPYLLDNIIGPVYYTCLAAFALIALLWIGRWVMDWLDYRKRRAAILDALGKASNGDREKHFGALAALERIYRPGVDKSFRLGTIDIPKFVAGATT